MSGVTTPQTEPVSYKYTTAWKVAGGINLPVRAESVVLHETDRCKFVLTSKADSYLAILDRTIAAGTVLLKGLFNATKFPDVGAALDNYAQEAREARRSRAGGEDATVLIIEATGICHIASQERKEIGGLAVTFDAIDGDGIRNKHKGELETIKLALACESEIPSRFEELASGIWLTDGTGRTVHNLNIRMGSVRLFTSKPLTHEKTASIRHRYDVVLENREFRTVRRLIAQMVDNDDEPLKAFLFGWTSLETLVAKAFKTFEREFMEPLAVGSHPQLRERFLARVRSVMNDKYRLREKFDCVTAVLFPRADALSVDRYVETFERLKEMRDSIVHGNDFEEASLPVHELSVLLRKYVVAWLEHKPCISA